MIYIKKRYDFFVRLTITSLALVIFLIVLACSKPSKANEYPIEDYQMTIDANNIKINQCIAIKEQLHITANLIRQQEFYDENFVKNLSDKWLAQHEYQTSLESSNNDLFEKIKELKSKEFIGKFKITHYCICSKCCGKSPSHPNYGVTASGKRAVPGRTIAVDTRVIPLGTKVVIDGHTYIAEDTGGAIKGNRIDICVSSHSEALRKGVRHSVSVYKSVK